MRFYLPGRPGCRLASIGSLYLSVTYAASEILFDQATRHSRHCMCCIITYPRTGKPEASMCWTLRLWLFAREVSLQMMNDHNHSSLSRFRLDHDGWSPILNPATGKPSAAQWPEFLDSCQNTMRNAYQGENLGRRASADASFIQRVSV